MIKAVVCVNWTEYERGWGHRPDGHTLHTDMETAKAYVNKTLYGRKVGGPVPDEYTDPGEPFIVEVIEEVYNKVQEEKTIWGHHTNWYAK